jgi:hypothetical protein
MKPFPTYAPDWRWGTAEGSREFDRQVDRAMTLADKIQWLEEAETLVLMMHLQRRPAGAPDASNAKTF